MNGACPPPAPPPLQAVVLWQGARMVSAYVSRQQAAAAQSTLKDTAADRVHSGIRTPVKEAAPMAPTPAAQTVVAMEAPKPKETASPLSKGACHFHSCAPGCQGLASHQGPPPRVVAVTFSPTTMRMPPSRARPGTSPGALLTLPWPLPAPAVPEHLLDSYDVPAFDLHDHGADDEAMVDQLAFASWCGC